MCRQKRSTTRFIGTNVLSIGIPNGLDRAFYASNRVTADLTSIIRRCRPYRVCTIVSGPMTSSVPPAALEAGSVVIGEAEDLIATLARDPECSSVHPTYQAAGPSMEHIPLPDLNLIRLNRYSTMTVQYSR